MKIIILLGLIGATSSAPLVSQRLLSASNSHEGAFNPWISPFPGFLQQQQQAQASGRSPFSLSTLDSLAGLFPNQIPFSGQTGFAQGGQAGQPELSQLQTPPQTQQVANLMSYMVPFKAPEGQTQMIGYYPVYMLLPWEQTQQAVTSPPQQTGPQLFEEQIPSYQFGYIPQAEPDVQRGQQHLSFDTFVGTAPETPGMPTEEGPLYSQREPVNFKHNNAEVFMPSTLPKSSTDNIFTSAIDPTIAPALPEQKNSLKKMKVLLVLSTILAITACLPVSQYQKLEKQSVNVPPSWNPLITESPFLNQDYVWDDLPSSILTSPSEGSPPDGVKRKVMV